MDSPSAPPDRNQPVLIEGKVLVSRAIAIELAMGGIITGLPPAEVNVAELNDAAVTALYDEARAHAAQLLRQRTVTKLATAILLDIKADGPPPLPSTEHQARELLGTLGRQLSEASDQLFAAAARLRHKGDTFGASRAYEAGQQTKAAAQGVR